MNGKHERPGSGGVVQSVLDVIQPRWKALIGFVTPGAVILGGAVTEASKGGERVTKGELLTALVAMVATSLGVYAKGNKDRKAEHQDESVQPPERTHDRIRKHLDRKGLR